MMRIGFIILYSYLVVSVFITTITEANADETDCASTKIWGPGLDPVNLILPVRYFFVEAFDKNNSRYVFLNQHIVFSY